MMIDMKETRLQNLRHYFTLWHNPDGRSERDERHDGFHIPRIHHGTILADFTTYGIK